jgi:methionyl-tRNA synthetase
MLGFIKKGLQDFSISRSTARARGVGVPVPGDATQNMYVWFDALAIYMTAIGWGYDQNQFDKFWPADVHVIGKGINRFHSVYWIGMLLSAGLATPKAICVHGYITANGQKMSKSLGNVIDPFEVVEKYGLEPVRYYLLKEIPTHNDGDFSYSRFGEVYTADLANGFGNLCSRLAKLAEKTSLELSPFNVDQHTFEAAYQEYFAEFELDQAAKWVAAQIRELDQYLSTKKPWAQSGVVQQETLITAINQLRKIAYHLIPFLPKIATQVLAHFSGSSVSALSPLFPRLPDSTTT